MMNKTLLIVLSIALTGLLTWMLWPTKTEKPVAPNEGTSPITQESTQPTAIADPSYSTWDRTIRLPLLSRQGAIQTTLRVQRQSESRLALHIKGVTASNPHAHWSDLLTTASFIARESIPAPPVGLQITWNPGPVVPTLRHLGPLTLAIRCALTGQHLSEKHVFSGTVSPGFQLVASEEVPASDNGAPHTATAAHTLQNRYWNQEGLKTPPARSPNKKQPQQSPSKTVLSALQQVLGQLVHGEPATLPVPGNWDQLAEQSEGRFRSTQFETVAEVFELGLLAANLRAAFQEATWATKRIPLFSQRLIREHRHQELAGWRLDWLTRLVRTRIHGEERVQRLMKSGPPSVARKQTVQVPVQWLQQRAETLDAVATSMTRLWRRSVQERSTFPHAYPTHDLRNMAWSPSPNDPHSSPLADWATAMNRMALAWAQLTILNGLNPQSSLASTPKEPWQYPTPKAVTLLETQTLALNQWQHNAISRHKPALPHTLGTSVPEANGPLHRLETLWRQMVLRRSWRALQSAADNPPVE